MRIGKWTTGLIVMSVGLCFLWGCDGSKAKKKEQEQNRKPAAAGGTWTAQRIRVVEKLDGPECVVVDPATGVPYVSNCETASGAYWAEDGTGFISRLKPGGEMDALRWQSSTKDVPLNGPKGMCVTDTALYVADNRRVVCYPLKGAAVPHVVKGVGGGRLNDMAAQGGSAYVSDTAGARIVKFNDQGITEMKAPASVNGITFFKGKMFAVSWGRHEVYELDPEGKADPKPFGLAKHFESLDGIEVLDDGTFVVSDYVAGTVHAISPDRKTVRTLADGLKTPADIGLDRKRGLLYVPQLEHNRVAVYKLEKK